MSDETPVATESTGANEAVTDRRGFLDQAAAATMAGGLVAGYGMLGAHAIRFLYPTTVGAGMWQYVCRIADLAIGQSLSFELPGGAKVVVARQTEGDEAEAFIALSSVCPHLGCKVHWEAVNNRFFCPCHNGAFDAAGVATEGPPATAGQSLTRYPLSVENGLLMIEVPTEAIQVTGEETA
ncbi:MAG: Rieske (2Fe-2S) protein [Planctomycetaceae bacterium]